MDSGNPWLDAQKIALGPIIFQAARLLKNTGILSALRQARRGLDVAGLGDRIELPAYGIVVLLEAGLAAGLVRQDGGSYRLTATGFCLLTDEATGINMDVVHECCYQPAFHLEQSIETGKPVGLHRVFGDWESLYPALPELPDRTRESWLRWDHYYSDAAMEQALPLVFERAPRNLLDVGGNNGAWAVRCAQHDPEVSVTVLDLPAVVPLAGKNADRAGLRDRIQTVGTDLLDHSRPFPAGFDAIWMGQLLVCFSEDDVTRLLERAAAAMTTDTRLYILDNFWDRQAHEIGAFCLQAFSLYFTFLATGRSRMYRCSDIRERVEAAGLLVDEIHDELGVCSSLMVCRRA